jgi:hypothetical protein
MTNTTKKALPVPVHLFRDLHEPFSSVKQDLLRKRTILSEPRSAPVLTQCKKRFFRIRKIAISPTSSTKLKPQLMVACPARTQTLRATLRFDVFAFSLNSCNTSGK